MMSIFSRPSAQNRRPPAASRSPAPAGLTRPLLSVSPGQVKRSSPKKPRSRNIFSALFCCLRAQDVPPLPQAQGTLPQAEENGPVAKIPGPCLLPEVTPQDQGKMCVVIDLDETLVHSSFKVRPRHLGAPPVFAGGGRTGQRSEVKGQ
nr:PREDICTED: carboxy-terminal domain RNA polymerase II polypeptide A small phosphatase 2-like [Lepisosteus oculatus]